MAAIDELTALGEDEARRQRELAAQQQQQINDYINSYTTRAADYRTQLANKLSGLAQEDFRAQNPYILEDAAARGYATSPTELANVQSRYLADLSRGNQQAIMGLENQDNSNAEALRQEALAAGLQGGQNALDAVMEMRRTGIERDYALSDQARQEALANALARRSSRDSMTGALIGSGGSILGGLLGRGAGLGGLFGGGAMGGGGAAGGATAGGAAAGVGGLGSIGMGPLALGALGYAASSGIGSGVGQLIGKGLYKSNAARTASRKGAQIGAIVGGPLGGVVGGAAGGAVKSVGKAFKKAFCFDAKTPIEMEDGSELPIHLVVLGDKTKGGEVYSIRKSYTAPGTLYSYQGTTVTGSHAVKEGGEWKRVADSTGARPIEGGGVVYSLVTEKHRIYINGIEFADEHETDNYEELSIDESLDALNQKEAALA